MSFCTIIKTCICLYASFCLTGHSVNTGLLTKQELSVYDHYY